MLINKTIIIRKLFEFVFSYFLIKELSQQNVFINSLQIQHAQVLGD